MIKILTTSMIMFGACVSSSGSTDTSGRNTDDEKPFSDTSNPGPGPGQGNPDPTRNDLDLMAGLLNVNDAFTQTESRLFTCENSVGTNGQFALQVGARVSGEGQYNPGLVRIEFSSDTSEWVGSASGENEVYLTQKECEASGSYCEEVVVGEGTSGYFEIDDGYIGIQNIWCRYFGGSAYQYTISAHGIDMNPWPYEIFTETAELVVKCIPLPCCPDNDYISKWGNHTVEPWECP
jgi:hypothetical protein